ncbi:MAG: TIGR04086 family membrane protein [Clostridia bacterium]|nr:TIGR04086 family membrane protein [Clostridia bacterium]
MPKKIDYIFLLKVLIIEVLTTVAAMFIFALVLFFLEGGYQFSPLFATISLGLGCFLASLYAAGRVGKNGLLIGAIVGGATFLIVTLAGLMGSKEIFSLNTFFRLIILMLLSLIGGVLGVNSKQNQRFI